MHLDISFISSNEIMILLRGGTEKCLAYIHSNKKRIFLQVLYDVLFATEVTCVIRFRIPSSVCHQTAPQKCGKRMTLSF